MAHGNTPPRTQWAQGCGGAGETRNKRAAYPPLTFHSSCPTPAENSLDISSRCRMPVSLRRVMAYSFSFRCGTSLLCAHIPQRGEGGGLAVGCWVGSKVVVIWINGLPVWESLRAGAAPTLYVTISHASGTSIV